MPEIVTATDLRALAREPNWLDADPERNHYIAVDLAEPVDDPTVLRWLARQPIPIIGVGGASDAVDVLVDTEQELARAVANIKRAPVAAGVLVQVLRAGETLETEEALALESFAYATLQAGSEFAAWLAAYREDHPAEMVAPRDDMVLLERDGSALSITLNSAETRNSLSAAMRDALSDAFKLVCMDTTIERVQVSGNGPCFSSGGELCEFGLLPDAASAHRIRMARMPARYLAPCADRCTVRVHRTCIGAGIELPAFANRVEATANASFQLPELGMGLIPGAGGCVSIPRRIGRQRAAYMALLGKRIPAARALEWGLVDAIVD